MPALKYYDLSSSSYKYVTGGMSQAAADARYQQKNIFANEAARDTAIPAPAAGTSIYLLNWKQFQVYRNGKWTPYGGDMPAIGAFWTASAALAPGAYVTHKPFTGGTWAGGATWTYSNANGTITIPYSGKWAITVYMEWSGLTAGQRLWLRPQSGGSPLRSSGLYLPSSDILQTHTSFEYLAAGTVFSVSSYNTAAGVAYGANSNVALQMLDGNDT